jgi:hypothetical protein
LQSGTTEKRVKILEAVEMASDGSKSERKKRIKLHDPKETAFYQKLCLANSRISVFKQAFMSPQLFEVKNDSNHLIVPGTPNKPPTELSNDRSSAIFVSGAEITSHGLVKSSQRTLKVPRVLMPTKITNSNVRVAVLEKLRLMHAIKERQLHEMKRPPVITQKDRANMLRPYSVKHSRPQPLNVNPPKSLEGLSKTDRDNLLRAFKVTGGKSVSRD